MTPAGAPLAEVVAAIEARYDPALAEGWDAVGLVCGDPAETVRSVLLAVDPTAAVVDEAVAGGVDLVVTHHPLFLTPVHGVPADDPKGRLVHRLVRAGAGLFVAHTNADRAAGHGVNDALAAALELAGELVGSSLPAQLAVVRSVDAAFALPLAEGVQFEKAQEQGLFETGEAAEGIAAFLAKRRPDFA